MQSKNHNYTCKKLPYKDMPIHTKIQIYETKINEIFANDFLILKTSIKSWCKFLNQSGSMC